MRDLGDHGQAYIDSLARLGGKADALRGALAKPIGGVSAADTVEDRSRFDRTLVVSVSKGPRSRPGDRLMRTIVEIVPDRQFRFAGCKVVSTDTRTLNVEHVEQKTTTSLQVSIAPKFAGSMIGTASLTGGVSDDRDNSADIAPSFENLNVDITPSMLRITRESERNLDLTGNTVIALSMAANMDAAARGGRAALPGG